VPGREAGEGGTRVRVFESAHGGVEGEKAARSVGSNMGKTKGRPWGVLGEEGSQGAHKYWAEGLGGGEDLETERGGRGELGRAHLRLNSLLRNGFLLGGGILSLIHAGVNISTHFGGNGRKKRDDGEKKEEGRG